MSSPPRRSFVAACAAIGTLCVRADIQGQGLDATHSRGKRTTRRFEPPYCPRDSFALFHSTTPLTSRSETRCFRGLRFLGRVARQRRSGMQFMPFWATRMGNVV